MIHLCYLAAGSAVRFGSNKLLALLDGKPLWQYGYEVLLKVQKETGAALHVVTRTPEILSAVREAGVDCPEAAGGLSYSVRAACKTVGKLELCDKILFLVADQPRIRKETVMKLLAVPLAATEAESAPLAACASDGERLGNPTVFSACLLPALLALEGDRGGKSVLKKRPDRVATVLCPPEELFDVDEAADLASLTR